MADPELAFPDIATLLLSTAFHKQASDHIVRAQIGKTDEDIRYQTLVEQIPAIIFIAYVDGSIGKIYVSPYIEEALGFSQEEWIHDPIRWYRQIHPEDRSRWSEEAAELFASAKPLHAVYRVLARSGRVVWFQCEVKMVRRPDGTPWFIHGVGFDITELKTTEEALQRAHRELEKRVAERTAELQTANDELAKANTDLEQFAFSVTHDLQEPVRTLAVFGDMLESRCKGNFDEETKTIISTMVSCARRMTALVRDLLAYTRLSDVVQETASFINTSAVVQTVLKNLQVAIAQSGAEITAAGLPEIRMPLRYAEELFQNLISNAIKYRSTVPLRIHISCAAALNEYIFSVTDNGIGIRAEYHEKIFAIFKRLHSADEYPGSGMGLAICRRIIERCGGRIWVQSVEGKGATFSFALPRSAK